MKRRLFHNFLLVGLLAVFLCCACLLAVMAGQTERQAFRQLAEEAMLARQGYDRSGDAWLQALRTDWGEASLRLTHVAADGTVLMDTEADAAGMTNHLDREEIAQALASGQGQTIHRSETLMERTLYYAVRLSDGSVLRVACTQSSALSVLIRSLPMILAVLLALTCLCVLLSARLSSQLVRPINAVDLDQPDAAAVYPELAPLVKRIQRQNKTIREQMAQLLQRQQEFTAMTENMSEGFLLLSRGMEVLSGNHAAFRLLQMQEGQMPTRLTQCCRVPRIINAAGSALSGIREEGLLSLGGMSWQMIASPVAADGQLTGAVILLLDVTEREKREVLRREFSANVSHELKTPLTSISGYAELMKEGLLPPEKTREVAATIHGESQRLIHLIGDIINLSQLDEADGRFEREPVDLYALSGEVLDTMRPAAAKRNITLSLHGDPATVTGVPHVLREMLYNLCDNAIKYNKDGGSVTVTVWHEPRYVLLSVRDTGIGIPYEEQTRVFERFYRVDKSRSRSMGGTGLGLSIVKHGAQLHRAEIRMESEPGQGTTFTIQF